MTQVNDQIYNEVKGNIIYFIIFNLARLIILYTNYIYFKINITLYKHLSIFIFYFLLLWGFGVLGSM